MSNIEEMSTIIFNFDRDGIRFLILFKTLKSQITLELRKENRTLPNEKLNKLCVNVANRLLSLDKLHPSEDVIKQLLCENKSEKA